MLGPQGSFFARLAELAAERDDFAVLAADLAQSSGIGKFMRECPNQFYNVGIAEQNMVNIAAGLAKTGFKTFAATFANFITMRSCEQVRVNMGYMKLPVKLVGARAGIVNGHLGNSHFCFEDIALMRVIPNLVVVSPVDAFEAVKVAEAAAESDQPMYIRLTGKVNTPMIYKEDYDFQLGKAVNLKEGTDIVIFTTGTIAANGLKAAKLLDEVGISTAVVNIHTIKPLDGEVLEAYAKTTKLWVSLEEHNIVGGLGSAIAEYKAALKQSPPQIFLGLPDAYGKAGEYEWMLEENGLSAQKIFERIKDYFNQLG
ncbi:Transketolase [Anaerovibrio sp. JC8]|nr:Transketolase [Anaerovibrio sp. JC8]